MATLNSIACRSVSDCMAVGANTPTMPTQLAAEQWNGKKWSRVAIPRPATATNVDGGGVACPAARECVAVGEYWGKDAGPYALAGYWNGARWTTGKAALPGLSSELIAVSCPTAASCYAVGEYSSKTEYFALIEHWNGKSWTRQVAPEPRGVPFAELVAVSCPTARFCVAVGTTGEGVLIERWNGATWTAAVPTAPSSSNLWGVSCTSAANCFAVGGTGQTTLAERWNGKSWSKSAAPATGSSPWLQSVSCVTAASCLAVGDDLAPRVFADLWNGKSWKPVSMATTGGHVGNFVEVQCLSAASCVALASVSPYSAVGRSESVFWNGKSWKVVATV